jgi:hypothetical protein
LAFSPRTTTTSASFRAVEPAVDPEKWNTLVFSVFVSAGGLPFWVMSDAAPSGTYNMPIYRAKPFLSLWVLSQALAAGLPGLALAEPGATTPSTVSPASPVAPAILAPAAVPPAVTKPASPPVAPGTRSEQDLAVRGIYLQRNTVQQPKRLKRLIERSLKLGINTFVVDVTGRSPKYEEAIKTIQDAGLTYVPRVAMFPEGARNEAVVRDQKLLEQRWGLVDYALSLGAKDIQLDYIRFTHHNADSPENATKILEVIQLFRQRIEQRGGRLQIDIFGEVAYAPSTHIGQDIARFAPALHAVCPMLYPSHFEPHEKTVKEPYRTVLGALTALDRLIQSNPIPVYAYLEPFNYRHEMSQEQRRDYFEEQLKAVLDSPAQGFYVWSAGNFYDVVFNVLQRRAERSRAASAKKAAPNAPARRALASTAGAPERSVPASSLD